MSRRAEEDDSPSLVYSHERGAKKLVGLEIPFCLCSHTFIRARELYRYVLWWFLTTQSQAAGSVLPAVKHTKCVTRSVDLTMLMNMMITASEYKRIQTNENSRRYGDGDDRKSFVCKTN